MGLFFSPVASYDALALMRQFSENTAAMVAEAQEVLNLSNKKSTLQGDLATDENTRPDKQPRMVHISYSFDLHCLFYVAYDLQSEKNIVHILIWFLQNISINNSILFPSFQASKGNF
jgi:hypothetical protein